MTGYIKLYRGWRDTDGLTPSTVYSDWEAWLWLLENAAWKEGTRFNAKGEEIRLSRGQIHVSLGSLSSSWGWTKKRVRTFISRLERVSKVGTAKGQGGTLLTICNYEEYQGEQATQGTVKGTVGAQPGHTQEEGKEGKKGNITRLAERPESVSPEVWADFIALRKAKRAPLTETALVAIEREAAKARWSLEAALTESVARGWQSFKAEWVKTRDDDLMANFLV